MKKREQELLKSILEDAYRAATMQTCGLDEAAKQAVAPWLHSWIVTPIVEALKILGVPWQELELYHHTDSPGGPISRAMLEQQAEIPGALENSADHFANIALLRCHCPGGKHILMAYQQAAGKEPPTEE